MSETRWGGTVAGTEVVLVDARLVIGGETVHRVRRAEPFLLRLDDGLVVEVRPAEARVAGGRELTGPFGALVKDPLAQAVLAAAPGDHVAVRIEGAIVRGGDRIAIEGVAHEEPTAGHGYRDAGPRRTTSIDARVIGVGSAPEAALASAHEREAPARREPPPPAPPEPVHGLGIAPALVATAAGLVVLGLAAIRDGAAPMADVSRSIPWLAGLGLASVGIFVARRRRWPPELREIGRRHQCEGAPFAVLPWMLTVPPLFAIATLAAWAAPHFGETDRGVALGAIGLAFGMPLVLAGALAWGAREDVGLARRLLRAKSLEPITNGRFGWLEGRLSDEIVRRRAYEVSSTRARVERVDASGTVTAKERHHTSTEWEEEIRAPERLFVHTEAGEVVVETRGALFASARRSLEASDGAVRSVHQTHESSSIARRDDVLVERARPGDAVLLLGRAQKEGDCIMFAARGPESLALYAVPAGRSPRAALRAAVAWHFAGVGAQLALFAVGVWILARLI